MKEVSKNRSGGSPKRLFQATKRLNRIPKINLKRSFEEMVISSAVERQLMELVQRFESVMLHQEEIINLYEKVPESTDVRETLRLLQKANALRYSQGDSFADIKNNLFGLNPKISKNFHQKLPIRKEDIALHEGIGNSKELPHKKNRLSCFQQGIKIQKSGKDHEKDGAKAFNPLLNQQDHDNDIGDIAAHSCENDSIMHTFRQGTVAKYTKEPMPNNSTGQNKNDTCMGPQSAYHPRRQKLKPKCRAAEISTYLTNSRQPKPVASDENVSSEYFLEGQSGVEDKPINSKEASLSAKENVKTPNIPGLSSLTRYKSRKRPTPNASKAVKVKKRSENNILKASLITHRGPPSCKRGIDGASSRHEIVHKSRVIVTKHIGTFFARKRKVKKQQHRASTFVGKSRIIPLERTTCPNCGTVQVSGDCLLEDETELKQAFSYDNDDSIEDLFNPYDKSDRNLPVCTDGDSQFARMEIFAKLLEEKTDRINHLEREIRWMIVQQEDYRRTENHRTMLACLRTSMRVIGEIMQSSFTSSEDLRLHDVISDALRLGNLHIYY